MKKSEMAIKIRALEEVVKLLLDDASQEIRNRVKEKAYDYSYNRHRTQEENTKNVLIDRAIYNLL